MPAKPPKYLRINGRTYRRAQPVAKTDPRTEPTDVWFGILTGMPIRALRSPEAGEEVEELGPEVTVVELAGRMREQVLNKLNELMPTWQSYQELQLRKRMKRSNWEEAQYYIRGGWNRASEIMEAIRNGEVVVLEDNRQAAGLL